MPSINPDNLIDTCLKDRINDTQLLTWFCRNTHLVPDYVAQSCSISDTVTKAQTGSLLIFHGPNAGKKLILTEIQREFTLLGILLEKHFEKSACWLLENIRMPPIAYTKSKIFQLQQSENIEEKKPIQLIFKIPITVACVKQNLKTAVILAYKNGYSFKTYDQDESDALEEFRSSTTTEILRVLQQIKHYDSLEINSKIGAYLCQHPELQAHLEIIQNLKNEAEVKQLLEILQTKTKNTPNKYKL
jgi:hypothetical protein